MRSFQSHKKQSHLAQRYTMIWCTRINHQGRFFFWVIRTTGKTRTFAHDVAFGVLYLSRSTAAWPSCASAFPARRHRAGVQESCSRRQSSQRAIRRGTKLCAGIRFSTTVTRVMEWLDTCRAAIIIRHVPELYNHNGNSDTTAPVKRSALSMGTQEDDA